MLADMLMGGMPLAVLESDFGEAIVPAVLAVATAPPEALAASELPHRAALHDGALRFGFCAALWVYAPASVQLKLLAALWGALSSTEEGRVRVRRVLGVQGVLDMLRACLWERAATEEDDGANDHQLPQRVLVALRPALPEDEHTATAAAAVTAADEANERPAARERQRLRVAYRKLAWQMMSADGGPTRAEADAVTGFLALCADTPLVLELLEALLRSPLLDDDDEDDNDDGVDKPQVAGGAEPLGLQLLRLSGGPGVLLACVGARGGDADTAAAACELAALRLLLAYGNRHLPAAADREKAAPNAEVEAMEGVLHALLSRISGLTPPLLEACVSLVTMPLPPQPAAAIRFPCVLYRLLLLATHGSDETRQRTLGAIMPLLVADDFFSLYSLEGWEQLLVAIAVSPPADGASRSVPIAHATVSGVAKLMCTVLSHAFREPLGYVHWKTVLGLIEDAIVAGGITLLAGPSSYKQHPACSAQRSALPLLRRCATAQACIGHSIARVRGL